MSYSLSGVVVVPSGSLANERLFRLLDRSRRPPDTYAHELPEDPSSTDFFGYLEEHESSILGLDVGLGGSADRLSEQVLSTPDGYGHLELTIPTFSLEGLPDHHELLLDALRTAFVELDGVYAVTVHELALAVERMPWEEFRTLPGGVHMLSGTLVEAVGRRRLVAAAPMSGDLEGGGLWLRFAEEYVYGMPEEHGDEMEALLEEAWEAVGLA